MDEESDLKQLTELMRRLAVKKSKPGDAKLVAFVVDQFGCQHFYEIAQNNTRIDYVAGCYTDDPIQVINKHVNK